MIAKKRMWDLFSPSAFKIYPSKEGGLNILEAQKSLAVGGKIPTFKPDGITSLPGNIPMEEKDVITQFIERKKLDVVTQPTIRRTTIKPDGMPSAPPLVRPTSDVAIPATKTTAKNIVGYGLLGTIVWSIFA